MLTYRRIAAIVLGAGLILAALPSAQAQVLWSLTLDNPNQSFTMGTAGTLIFTGTIRNNGSRGDLNLFGDSLTTGSWNSSLTLLESTSFLDFLNNNGTLASGQSYAGALFTAVYTAATPAAVTPPYNASFFVATDGLPSSLGASVTIRALPSVVGGSAPEPSSLCYLLLTGGAAGTLLLRKRYGFMAGGKEGVASR